MKPHLFLLLLGSSLVLAVSCGPTRGSVAPVPEVIEVGTELPVRETLDVRGDERIRPGLYIRRPLDGSAGAGRAGVIRIEGERDLTLDLTGVELRGTTPGTDMDESAGWGIVIADCKNITVRGGRMGGYKGCIVVTNSTGVTIEGMQFDSWYGDRLLSTVSWEKGEDWLYPHENDADEWITKYGAAISFTDCEDVTVKDCRGRHGQNGILLTRTNDSFVYDNDFSFLSGWGLGMYRASRNEVSHNLFEYCVRGYSHDVYWRGQDSAAILMFERCSDNVIAFNSATHSGDGIFLYGGQDIVEGRALERGERDAGGGDRNLFYGNDLSFSVANGIEATFSSHNVAIQNRMIGCHQHGVWGGYSNNFVIALNRIDQTLGGGIAIEHGQDCLVARNSLRDNYSGVGFWWDEDPPLVGGPFGLHHDTDSRDNWVLENEFDENDMDFFLEHTSGVCINGNSYPQTGRMLDVNGVSDESGIALGMEDTRVWLAGGDGPSPSGRLTDVTLRRWAGQPHARFHEAIEWRAPEVLGSQVTRAAQRNVEEGLATIVMGPWGPWDYRAGEDRPQITLPGGLFADCRWQATWFPWRLDSSDPRGDLETWRARRFDPAVRKNVGHWVDPWSDEDVRATVGNNYFGLIATTTIQVPKAGRYQLIIGSDDGIRVTIGDKVAFEDWTWHAPKRDTVELTLEPGKHNVQLEYFQITGAAALSLELEPLD
jgi:hypothetical protein